MHSCNIHHYEDINLSFKFTTYSEEEIAESFFALTEYFSTVNGSKGWLKYSLSQISLVNYTIIFLVVIYLSLWTFVFAIRNSIWNSWNLYIKDKRLKAFRRQRIPLSMEHVHISIFHCSTRFNPKMLKPTRTKKLHWTFLVIFFGLNRGFISKNIEDRLKYYLMGWKTIPT